MTRTTERARGAVVRQSVSVALATGLYGISFGALSVAAGLDVPQTVALSVLMFSGGSQFALVGVLGAGGGVGAAVATAGLLGARNGLYGPQVAPLLGVRGGRRLLAAHLTIDESTAVATAQSDRAAARTGFWWTGVGVFLAWNAFTLLGAVLGDALGDPATYGLDAAAAAAFLALVWPRLSGPDAVVVRSVAAAAVLVALAATPFLPAGVPVLLAAAVAILVGLLAPQPTRGAAEPAAAAATTPAAPPAGLPADPPPTRSSDPAGGHR